MPLLTDSLERVKDALTRILPRTKKRTVLEDAEWEDEAGQDGGFLREQQQQGALLLPRLNISYRR